MVGSTGADRDSVVVLYKGGRLPSWDALLPEQQSAFQREHVDLMLNVAGEHGLRGIEGFRLMTPQHTWERFWTIEFPSLAGAQAWIEAEMAPPYGRYGFYEYYMSMPWRQDYFSSWVTDPQPAIAVPADADPHQVPELGVARDSIVLLVFGRWRPESGTITPEQRGDTERLENLREVAREHGLRRYEAFKLIGPQDDWHLVWILEFADLAGAETWIDAEVSPPHGQYATRSFYLARRWAPEYFATWTAPR